MADKDTVISFKWDETNKVWTPLNVPKNKSFARNTVESIPLAGELIKIANKKADIASYSLPFEVYNDPNVIDIEDSIVNGNTTTVLKAKVSTVAKYNPLWMPQEEKPKPNTQTAAQIIAQTRGGAVPKTEEKKKVTPEEFGQRVKGILTPGETPESSYTRVNFDVSEVEAKGQSIVDPNTGISQFMFQLIAPGVINANGEPTQDMLPAVLLPGPKGRPMTQYHVEYLDSAVENTLKRYDKTKRLPELKKMLWESGYLTDAEYTQSIRGNNSSIADAITRGGLAKSLVDTSVKNFDLVKQKRYTPVSLEDELKDRYQPEAVANPNVAIPNTATIDSILNKEFMTKKGRKASMGELDDFRNQVLKAAAESVQRITKTTTEAGEPVNLYSGDSVFDEADIQDIASQLTKGDAETKSYYGAQRFANSLNRVLSESTTPSENLESLLR